MKQRGAFTWLGVLVAVLVCAADQGSKWWILHGIDLPVRGDVPLMPGLDLTMVWNRGVTFGLLNGLGPAGGWLLAAGALLVVAALAVWLRRAEGALVSAAIGAIAGGAIGNVADRLRHGAVVDFVHAHAFGWSWYVFNLADAAIVCGVAVLVLEGLFPRRRDRCLADAPDRG